MSIRAVFFDMDGVIIDTERDGHRPAFNMTFKEFGFSDDWSVDYYHELIQIGGGKERLKHHLKTKGFSKPVRPEEADKLIQDMHKRKTALFVDLIASGNLQLRPGVHRFMKEAMDAGLTMAVCTTANEQAVHAVLEKALSDIKFDVVLAGDVVAKKKPDPEIYNLALAKTTVQPEQAFVVEDSRIGVLATKAAGLRVVVTTNYYTQNEDVSGGDIIVTCLGDPQGTRGELRKGAFKFDGVLRLNQVLRYFEK